MNPQEQKIYMQLVQAIQAKQLVSFVYKDTKTGNESFKTVKPFQVGIHKTTGNVILSAWYLPENGKSDKESPSWRIYRLSNIFSVISQLKTFDGNRVGYSPGGNELMKEILVSITD